ncbi:MAG: HAD family phosphatase [FCB group bacterium]|nr:HAD family phosphatase [FCB group bacterium]
MIKTIFFDIGGVLLEIDPERTARHWSKHAKIPVETVREFFPMDIHHQYERGLLSDREFFRAVKDALPGANGLDERAFWEGWRLLVGGETGASAILNRLLPDYDIWLLSNTNPRHILKDVARRYPFFKAVKGAIYSYEVGARKPEPEIFVRALEIAGTKPEESLFIDDVEVNVEQARRLGLETIRFVSVDDLKRRLRAMGIFRA